MKYKLYIEPIVIEAKDLGEAWNICENGDYLERAYVKTIEELEDD